MKAELGNPHSEHSRYVPKAVNSNELQPYAAWDASLREEYDASKGIVHKIKTLSLMSLAAAKMQSLKHVGEKGQEILATIKPDDSELQQWNSIVHATIADTAFGRIWQKAREKSEKKEIYDRGFASTQEDAHKMLVDISGDRPTPRPIPEGIYALEKLATMRNLEFTEESVTDARIKKTASFLSTMVDIFRPEHGEWQNMLDMTDLSHYAGGSFLGLRRLNKTSNSIDYSRLLDDHEEDTVGYKLYDIIRLIRNKDPDERRAGLLELLDDEQANNPKLQDPHYIEEVLYKVYSETWNEFIINPSLAAQALVLNENLTLQINGKFFLSRVDWLEKASPEFIKHTFNKCKDRKVDMADIEKEATLEYIFGEVVTLPELEQVYPHLNREIVFGLASIRQLCLDKGMDFSPLELYTFGVRTEFNPSEAEAMLHSGYSIKELVEHQWLMTSVPQGIKSQPFPASQTEVNQHRWLCNNAATYLDRGWNQAAIGRIISSRLKVGEATNLENASQWLQAFQIPEQDANGIRYYDVAKESQLLAGLLHVSSDEKARLQLSDKTHVMQQLFWEPEHQLLYQVLNEKKGDVKDLKKLVREKRDAFYDQVILGENPSTTIRITRSAFFRKIDNALTSIAEFNPSQTPASAHDITSLYAELKGYGANRKEYITQTTNWLLKHTNLPKEKVLEAWHYRDRAIADGSDDSIRDILLWKNKNEFALLSSQEKEPDGGLSNGELIAKYPNWISELARHYTLDETLEAIRVCAEGGNQEARIAPTILPLEFNGKKWFGEVLAKTDPRGLTIGPDTGCCMRWNKEAHKCIVAGYKNPNAGFFAVYAPNGRIAAHSAFFVDEKHPETIVMDSIEANKGRDDDMIKALHEQFWSKYITNLHVQDENNVLVNVNVGRYLDQDFDKRIDVTTYPEVEAVASPAYYYSEAEKQGRLFTFDPQSSKEAKSIDAVQLPGESAYKTATVRGKEVLVSDLEARIYPDDMHYYKDFQEVTRLLEKKRAEDSSFFIFNEKSNEPVGYCIAYHKIEGGSRILMVQDLGILPDYEVDSGKNLIEEIRARAEDMCCDGIEVSLKVESYYPKVHDVLVSDMYEISERTFITTEAVAIWSDEELPTGQANLLIDFT